LDLGLQRPWVEDHAVPDYRERAGDDAAGQQTELVDLVAHHQRVAGVVPALEADHGIGAAGEPVDDLALAFIAPLGADHGYVGHSATTCSCAVKTRRALGRGGRKGKARGAYSGTTSVPSSR